MTEQMHVYISTPVLQHTQLTPEKAVVYNEINMKKSLLHTKDSKGV